jgi:hypothetical protein
MSIYSTPEVSSSNSFSGLHFRPLGLQEFHLASGPEGVQWPESAVILGAWRGKELVGWIALISLPHIEGIWVDPEEREAGGAIARELHRQVEAASELLGREVLFAFVPDETHSGMAAHLLRAGYTKIPMTLYGKRL